MGIGEVAMHQAHRHSTIELSQDVTAPLKSDTDIDPEVCASDLVDFSPVYRCLHIFSVLVYMHVVDQEVYMYIHQAYTHTAHTASL